MTTVDWGGYLAPGIELIYEHAPGSFRAQWDALQESVTVVRPRTAGGDRQAPHMSLAVDGRRPGSHLWDRDVAVSQDDPVSELEPAILHENAAGRLRALDRLGIDIQILNPGATIAASRWLPSNLAAGVLGAYNRFALAYAAAAPDRLQTVVQLHGGEPEWSASEIRELAAEDSVAAASLWMPGVAPDEPRFMPVWQALEENRIPLLHRPEFCSPIWTSQRLLAVIGFAGIFERFTGIKIVFGSGTDWVEQWLDRLDKVTAGSRRGPGVKSLVQEGRIYVGVAPDESVGGEAPVTLLQADHLLWETGFPYRMPDPLGSDTRDTRLRFARNRGPGRAMPRNEASPG